jgi:dihydroflavonol-4-reductase
MRAFVTGATGFIGGHVARRLVSSGWDVTALARSPERGGPLRELGVTLVPGDVTEPSSLAGPIAKADAVFHLAAWYQLGVTDRMRMFQINVKGTENDAGGVGRRRSEGRVLLERRRPRRA